MIHIQQENKTLSESPQYIIKKIQIALKCCYENFDWLESTWWTETWRCSALIGFWRPLKRWRACRAPTHQFYCSLFDLKVYMWIIRVWCQNKPPSLQRGGQRSQRLVNRSNKHSRWTTRSSCGRGALRDRSEGKVKGCFLSVSQLKQ